ncbi:MAG: hypothetical protein LBQ28_10505 [Prevotellaceae bacterium]|jgi:hypothetical protein|nr:hypothetical protein [Prevotellaceae bacterium]
MKKKLTFITVLILLITSCVSVLTSENAYNNSELKKQLAALETKLDKNNKLLQTLVNAIQDEPNLVDADDVAPTNNSTTESSYDTKDNVEALNLFLKENQYIARIGYNFNTDKRKDILLFAFRNSSKLRGFGIVKNGTVYATSFGVMYFTTGNCPYAVWNGDYIVFAVNGGITGDCGLFGYAMKENDFITIKRTWTNKNSSVRYVGIRPYSEIVDDKYYVSVYRVDGYMSTARVNMATGDMDFTDNISDAKEMHVTVKVNNLYYGLLIKDRWLSYVMASAPQYYNIFDNYKIIRSDFSPTTFNGFNFSYTKKRLALIDFTDNIARPVYLNGVTDNNVPATLTKIPEFEYKNEYYVNKTNDTYTQFEKIEVPYDLFNDKYIKLTNK